MKRLLNFIFLIFICLWSNAQPAYSNIEILLEQEKTIEAEIELHHVFGTDTTNYDYVLFNGRISKQRNNYLKAIYLLEKCIAIDPNKLLPYGYLANMSMRQKQYGRALFYCDQALAKEPLNLKFLNEKAVIYYEQVKYDSAYKYMRQLADIDPTDADFQYNVGVVLINLKKHKQALSYLSRSDSLRPNDTKTLFDRGMAHYYLGYFNYAIDDFERSANLNSSCTDEFIRPKLSSTYKFMGLSYAKVGNKSKALTCKTKSNEYLSQGR